MAVRGLLAPEYCNKQASFPQPLPLRIPKSLMCSKSRILHEDGRLLELELAIRASPLLCVAEIQNGKMEEIQGRWESLSRWK